MKLALGTVQFGLPYGIANAYGQVSFTEARAIVDCAAAAGLDTLDTAAAYGDSEHRLGEIGVRGWRIISKLPRLPTLERIGVEAWVDATVRNSLRQLRVPRLAGLLLHHPVDLLSENGPSLRNALLNLQRAGLIGKLGVSIYAPGELDALAGRVPLEIVQAPLNVFDRRLVTSGWLDRLHAQGTEVHVRSVFLQGLLLLDQAARPPQFARWGELWSAWERHLAATNQSALQACLGFAACYPNISRIVVGTDSRRQLEDILNAAPGRSAPVPEDVRCDDPLLIEPSRWVRPAAPG